MLKAFQIIVNGKTLDYRLGKKLNLDQVRDSFEKKYTVRKLWSGGRHILGTLEKDGKVFFLKLATTEGISEVTKNEYNWNEQFNKLAPRKTSNFWVPQNKDCGVYNGKLFYIITDKFDGELLAKRPERIQISITFSDSLPIIIEFSELIQQLKMSSSDKKSSDYKKMFLEKTKSWYEDIPDDIKEKYEVENLWKIVRDGLSSLEKKPRHGDFTPWHLFILAEGRLGLIDGEHAMKNGVEYYDIGYFIQRVFSILQNPSLAKKILSMLGDRKYNIEKLKVILASRGIGGFLDASLTPHPDYAFCESFKNWVIKLND